MFHRMFWGRWGESYGHHPHGHRCGHWGGGRGGGGHRGMFFGGPMGGRGGRGGGGGRRFGPGDLRLMLLSLIEEKQRHGYELIKELELKFGGAYAPSPGSVYPTLTLLEELGHVRSTTTEGSKRLYEITDEGRKYLRENEAMLNSVRKRMAMAARAASCEMPPEDLHHAMHTLRAALMFHRGGWTEEETERVRRIIEAAAEEISQGRDNE
ncbi:PadR family transcriptional regulator [Steroidobacter agaridevorans]|uniref:PadR family transcriptional regulator n=1 Tax=Steroidobacter agaridevorans TaxID=2695856 RepID=UPI00137B1E2F|nr:PadR family transcriptional regulator [Steroidobacter agaridevorans]